MALVSTSWNTGLPLQSLAERVSFKDEGLKYGGNLGRRYHDGASYERPGRFRDRRRRRLLRGIARGAPVVGQRPSQPDELRADERQGIENGSGSKGKTIGITGIGGMGEFTVVESCGETD